MEEIVKDRVVRILSKELNVRINDIIPAASLTDDLGANSLNMIEIIIALEKEFGIEIPEKDADRIITVEDVLKYIQKRFKNKID